MRQPGCAPAFSRLIPAQGWLLAAAGLLTVALGGCDSSQAPPPSAAPPSVVAEPAKKELVEDQASYVGRVVAINKVELRARVEGFLQERRFTEGDRVEEGQILFLIEPDQYKAEVEQRQADLESAKASELNASAQLKRGQELLQSNNIAQSKVDELQAAESVAQASIAQAKAALNVAELNLGYTEIVAPVAGRVGLANFTVGNLVGPSSGTLATLVSRDPIYVQFPVTQRELLDARKQIEESGGNAKDVKVQVELPDGSTYDHIGHLDFVDVTTNETTDSVTLRAEVANPKGILIDGQFVNLRLALGDPEEALVIPQSALQVDQQGVYIFVVDKDNKAQTRRVETGPAKGGDIAITKGLKPGELVIVEGIQKVRPGQPVKASPPQETDDSGANQNSDGDASSDEGTSASKPSTDSSPRKASDQADDKGKPDSQSPDARAAPQPAADNDQQGRPGNDTDSDAATAPAIDPATDPSKQAANPESNADNDQGTSDNTSDRAQAEQAQNSEANAL